MENKIQEHTDKQKNVLVTKKYMILRRQVYEKHGIDHPMIDQIPVEDRKDALSELEIINFMEDVKSYIRSYRI